MRVKKIKRICGVRGCKNTHNVYALSQRTEMGNSVIMCEDCMKEALKTIAEYNEPAKQTKPELEVTLSSVADVVEPEPQEVIEAKTEELTELVAEDTVTIEEDTTKAPAPKPRATANTKKKTNKKK